jgi:hypothetical protein
MKENDDFEQAEKPSLWPSLHWPPNNPDFNAIAEASGLGKRSIN